MPKKIFFLTLVIFFTSCSRNFELETAERFKNHALNNATNAASLAIVDNGKTYFFNYGNNVQSEPVNENTIYEGASLSKTFLVWLFHQTMQDKINASLEDLGINDEDLTLFYEKIALKDDELTYLKKITIKALLSHTSGIENILNHEEPNNFFHYSDPGYLLLQFVWEQLYQKSFVDGIQTLLNDSTLHFVWQPKMNNNYVHSFTKIHHPDREIRKNEQPFANGTLLCSASGLVKFATSLSNDFFEFVQENQIIIDTTNPDFTGLFWGNGMGIEKLDERTFLWQWGSNWCYNSVIIVEPKSKTIYILLTNTLSGRMAFMPLLRELVQDDRLMCLYHPWRRGGS
jgi:CubicO group peptidase (beta-lactamase class C family)